MATRKDPKLNFEEALDRINDGRYLAAAPVHAPEFTYSVVQSTIGRVSMPDSYTTPAECLARAATMQAEDVLKKSLFWCEVARAQPRTTKSQK